MAASTKTWLNNSPPSVEDDDLNGFAAENNNLIVGSGQALTTGDKQQTHKAVSTYAHGGNFYTDGGAADAYVLSVIGAKVAPAAYFVGMTIIFVAGNTNTGASTVNAAALGVKSLKNGDGAALLPGHMAAGSTYEFRYDGTDFVDSDLTSIANVAKGSARVGVYQNIAGYVGRTLSSWILERPFYVTDFMTAAEVTDIKAGTLLVDVTAAAQAALDSAGSTSILYTTGATVVMPKGRYKITDSLKLKSSWVTLVGEGEFATTLEYSGAASTACIQIGASMAATTIYTYNRVSNLAIKVITVGAWGIQYDKCQFANFQHLSVQLSAASQIAFYGKGNGTGAGPYYNSFDDIVVIGSGLSTQIAFGFYLNTTGVLDAPNGNAFTNIKRIASVGTAFDLQVGQSNMFTNIGCESISEYVFRFSNVAARESGTATSGTASSLTDTGAAFPVLSNGTLVITAGTGAGTVAQIRSSTATVVTLDQSLSFAMDNTTEYELYDGRCSANKVINVRHEGTSTTFAFENGYGGNQNCITNVFSTGADALWHNKSLDFDSHFATIGGQLFQMPFQINNLAANTTTKMLPSGGVSLAISGGWRCPKAGHIAGVATAVESFGGSGLGNATIKTFIAGAQQAALDHTINVNNRFGFTQMAVQSTPTRVRNQNITMQITTDAAWDQTGCDITGVVFIAT
jgi:fructose-specific phosphotransferase system component IIB